VKFQLIFNPHAGGGKGKKLFPAILSKIKRLGGPVDWVLSQHPQEALAAAFRAQERGFDLLIACGGDGTVHSLLPALVNRSTVLGVIPIGGANDLARNWGIPLDLDEALEVLSKGQPRAVDVIGTQSGTYIAGAVGVGFDAAVIERVRAWRQSWKGLLPYPAGAALEFFRYHPPVIFVAAGSWQYRGSIWQLLCTNIPRYGLFLKIAPPSKIDDGLMEICLIPDSSRAHLLLHALLLPFFGFKHFPAARTLSAPRLTVESLFPLKFHGDGELIGYTPADLRVLPTALQVMMPIAPGSG